MQLIRMMDIGVRRYTQLLSLLGDVGPVIFSQSDLPDSCYEDKRVVLGNYFVKLHTN